MDSNRLKRIVIASSFFVIVLLLYTPYIAAAVSILQDHNENSILQALAIELPELNINKLEILTHSKSNVVVEVNEDWIFRFPRTKTVAKLVEREAKLLSLLNESIDILIPCYEVYGKTVAMVGYRKIPGGKLDNLTYWSLNTVSRQKIADIIAEFLYQLHKAVNREALKELGYKEFYPDVQKIEDRLAGTFNDPDLNSLLEKALLAEQFQSVDSRNYVLLHNDLHPGNIAYDSLNERVNGVFDFTNAALGDLAIDFTSLFSIDVDLVQRVVRAYSQLSGCEGLFRRVLSMRVLILSMQILKAQERGDKVRALKKMDALSNMVSIWYAEEEKKASISRR